MRRPLLLLCLVISLHSFAQTDADSLLNSIQRNTDSINARIRIQDSINNKRYMDQQAERNMEGIRQIMNQVKENERRQKQQNMIRIGIGVLFLIVLVIGLMRRKKKS
jgi:hypothetical protein